MTPIPLFKVHMPSEVDEPLLKVLHSGYIGQGKAVDTFEQCLGEYFGNPYLLTLNSGTSALYLALQLIGVDGGSVISTPMTCSATNTPIIANGARIIWADIDPKTGLIDPEDVARKTRLQVTPPRAVVAVHWGGMPCDLYALNELPLPIIEDAAHAIGATYEGEKIGTISRFTAFSTQAIKHITTVDGGILACALPHDYRRGKLLRWYGIDREGPRQDMRCEADIAEAGLKLHMNDVNATIGLAQLPHLDGILAKHRANAAFYDKELSDFYGKPKVNYPAQSSYWLYTVLLSDSQERARFVEHMTKAEIAVSRVHSRNDTHSCFRAFKTKLPGVDEFSSKMICIPAHSALTEDERQYVVDTMNKFAQ